MRDSSSVRGGTGVSYCESRYRCELLWETVAVWELIQVWVTVRDSSSVRGGTGVSYCESWYRCELLWETVQVRVTVRDSSSVRYCERPYRCVWLWKMVQVCPGGMYSGLNAAVFPSVRALMRLALTFVMIRCRELTKTKWKVGGDEEARHTCERSEDESGHSRPAITQCTPVIPQHQAQHCHRSTLISGSWGGLPPFMVKLFGIMQSKLKYKCNPLLLHNKGKGGFRYTVYEKT